MLSRRLTVLTLAFTAAAVVTAEVLFTRLLSVVTWYGLAFLVLSLAMLGLTVGALDAARARRAGSPLRAWVARRMLAFAALLVAATVGALAIPLTFDANATSFGALLLVITLIAAPLAAAGGVVARLLAESSTSVSRLYAVDLVCAALGALAPLVLLGPLSAPGALVLVAVLAATVSFLLAPAGARTVAGTTSGVLLVLLALTELTPTGLRLEHSKGQPSAAPADLAFERWNALSYVRMRKFEVGRWPLWAPSPTVTPPFGPYAQADIDGDAGTPVYAFDSLSRLDVLRYDATTTAHAIRPGGRACIIGVGGGRDILGALAWGQRAVLGVEINPAMVEMLRFVRPVSPVLSDRRVTVRIGDGRGVLSDPTIHCDVLQASLVDTWAATGAGAFAHAEATLYTREAWSIFLDRVSPNGIVTFSRWYAPANPRETVRLVALAVGSLLDRRVARPSRHIALVAAGRVATILVKATPFDERDVRTLRALVEERRYTLIVAPDAPAGEPMLRRILASPSVGALARVGRDRGMDTSAPTDDRPFFFQLIEPSAWLTPGRTLAEATRYGGALRGNVAAMFELLSTLLGALLLAAALLGPAIVRAVREDAGALPGGAAAAYFSLLGLGFMLAEVALVQRLHLVLAHPTYALVVVLAGLLTATGIGSILGDRLLHSRRAVGVAALGAAVLLFVLPHAVIGPLAHATLRASMPARVAWSGLCAAAVGLTLGMLFPAGLRFTRRESATSLALALNGAAGVLGGVGAVLISVWGSISLTFAAAALAYLLAAVVGPWRWR